MKKAVSKKKEHQHGESSSDLKPKRRIIKRETPIKKPRTSNAKTPAKRPQKKKASTPEMRAHAPIAGMAIESDLLPVFEPVIQNAPAEIHEEHVSDLEIDEAHAAVEKEVAALVREVERSAYSMPDLFETRNFPIPDHGTGVRTHVMLPETIVEEDMHQPEHATESNFENAVRYAQEPLETISLNRTEPQRTPKSLGEAVLFSVALLGIAAITVIIGVGRSLQALSLGIAMFAREISVRFQALVRE